MDKKIICYFSASGVTKEVAKNLSKMLHCDLFEIKPLEEYTSHDLDWNDENSRSSLETKDITSRPIIQNSLDHVDDYSTILLGYPIWWDLAPRIINSFIESIDLTNKKVYVFATSGGSGIENSFTNLKKTYPTIHFVRGKLLSKYTTHEEILAWLGEN